MSHPYKNGKPYAFWRAAISQTAPEQVDPVVSFPFKLGRHDRIVTAGSCFAQHIARYLRQSGFNFYVTEPGHPLLDDRQKAEFNYGLFSARYGNIYTSRQLVQLFDRAYGDFEPSESAWAADKGRWLDPLRPTIHPKGFRSRQEMEADRRRHLRAVREAFEACDVFIFTLGLTETWVSAEDGTAFPVCPGVSGGEFDPQRHVFVNQSAAEVSADLDQFLKRLRRINPTCRVIFTVSPVPLVATAMDRHVLVSTTYSKSVLRVAAEEAARKVEGVAYFPSYEIITGGYARGAYFAEDMRSVKEEGVQHVMSLFFKHVCEAGESAEPDAGDGSATAASRTYERRMKDVVDVLCDEELLDA